VLPLSLFLISALAAAGLAAALGGFARTSTRHTDHGVRAEAESEAPDFAHPFADGAQVAAVAAAASHTPFAPAVPQTLGKPSAIFVHSGHVPRAEQGVALVYDTASHGRVDVIEVPTHWNARDLAQPVADCASGAASCEGTFATVTLDRGPALQITGPPSTVLIFVRNGVKYQIQGPDDSFSAADARQVGQAIEAARP
jgi:hypothetical protein